MSNDIHYISDGKGYVRYIDHMGSDLSAVNSARASFNKESKELSKQDERLIGFLAQHDPPHTSPFRHAYATFEVRAPIYVSRQWYKHIVGAGYSDGSYKDTGWNEQSGRYVAYDDYWAPAYFRVAPENKKQGSIDVAHHNNLHWRGRYIEYIDYTIDLYNQMVQDGVAPEQARAILPMAMYTHYYWTASFLAIAHFVNLRDHPDAQLEIKEYAMIIDDIMSELFPISWYHRKGFK